MAEASLYHVRISMSHETVRALNDGGFFLYTLYSVQMSNAAARPTLYSAMRNLTSNIMHSWSSAVSAYTSSSEIENGALIRIGYDTAIEPGQTLEVVAGGSGQVKSAGTPSEISVFNSTSTPFTSGFARAYSGPPVPIFAAPLYGHMTNVAAPLPKILLQISSERIEPGTVVESFAPRPGPRCRLLPRCW